VPGTPLLSEYFLAGDFSNGRQLGGRIIIELELEIDLELEEIGFGVKG